MKKKQTLTENQKNIIRKTRKIQIVLFVGMLGIFGVIGLLLPLRPSVSQSEKRNLAEFPTFTFRSFADGSYLSDISAWYADTYPERDRLITAYHTIQNLYGFEPTAQMIGSGNAQDEIPTQPLADSESGDLSDSGENNTSIIHSDTDSQTVEEKSEPKLPDSGQMEAEIQKQIQDGVYIENGSAYSMYYFNRDAADTYIQALNHAASELDGQTTVYSILVPNQSGVTLSEKTRRKLGGSDQEQAIDYYYASYENVKTVDTIHALRDHNAEYIYFRTDHHWTQLGAYYAYQNFCAEKGITAEQLSDYKTTQTFEPFLGSFYDSFGNSDMQENPDSVTAYYPNDTNDMTFESTDGTTYDWHVITDVNGWNSSSLYTCFIGGDNPLSVIKNPTVRDGSSCLVLKESYGNCFVPFLVDHYQTIYVIDFRYAKENVLQFVRGHKINDLIVINNITIIGSTDVSNTIQGLLQ